MGIVTLVVFLSLSLILAEAVHQCGPPPVPPNGQVLVDGKSVPDDPQDQRYPTGTIAEVICAKGYELIGNSSMICSGDGSWQGEEPLCGINVAQGKQAFQSSTDGEEYAANALNGGCSLTRADKSPWWMVYLGKLYVVFALILTSPPCCLVRLGDFEIRVGNSTEHGENAFCTRFSGKLDYGKTYVFRCRSPLIGTHVSIEMVGVRGSLYLCNVQVISPGVIDCLPVAEISHGEVVYSTGTTSPGSVATYSCDPNHKLEGNSTRTCNADGQWTGVSPYCREIRCPLPERPPATILSISTSDRLKALSSIESTDREATSSTFRIGSSVTYRCERGFRLEGKNSRVCQDGVWNGEAPSCTPVDCGPPEGISHGFLRFPNNDTRMGSYVQYSCEISYRLKGFKKRVCLENGSWSGEKPHCQRVTCQYPTEDPDSGLLISVSLESVGGVVSYQCQEGRRLVGPSSRKCQNNGQWEDNEPICELIDCQTPPDVRNGSVFLVNGTTTFGSIAQYYCNPGFTPQDPFERPCTASGEWSGPGPVCVPETKAIPDWVWVVVGVVAVFAVVAAAAAAVLFRKRHIRNKK